MFYFGAHRITLYLNICNVTANKLYLYWKLFVLFVYLFFAVLYSLFNLVTVVESTHFRLICTHTLYRTAEFLRDTVRETVTNRDTVMSSDTTHWLTAWPSLTVVSPWIVWHTVLHYIAEICNVDLFSFCLLLHYHKLYDMKAMNDLIEYA